ncbi:MAG: 50S ribosomal protein L19 [Planctomycetota bacterium]|nr:50S ribosomal protein L19 [Planctomycetota bacterium]
MYSKIKEGSKERVQRFSGVVISMQGGGISETFTVRRIVQGKGVEKTFTIQSPFLEKVVVTRLGRVRRAKLYYLRDRTGRATRPEELILSKEDIAKRRDKALRHADRLDEEKKLRGQKAAEQEKAKAARVKAKSGEDEEVAEEDPEEAQAAQEQPQTDTAEKVEEPKAEKKAPETPEVKTEKAEEPKAEKKAPETPEVKTGKGRGAEGREEGS